MSVCIIPARSGSRRIPNKNIRPFMGRPIISYSIATAQQSGLFDRIIVSTDGYEIAQVAERYGAEVMFRHAELARDEVGTQEVMESVLLDAYAESSEIACCLYPCAPFVTSNDLFAAIQMKILRPCRYVVAVAVDPLRDSGNFYVGEVSPFVEGVTLYGTYTGLYVMPPERAIDINAEADWIRAEQMYAALHKGE